MKTHEADCNPSVTLTISVREAMTIWDALTWYEKTHRKTSQRGPIQPDGLWGHYDCPPRVQPIFGVIKCSICEEEPNLFEHFFGYPANKATPGFHDPIPSQGLPQ